MAEPDVRPTAPQIRVQNQFRKTKFLSQQWQVAWKSLVRILALSGKLWTLAHWILTQILSFHDFLGGWAGGPRPLWVSASKPWSISIVCKNFRAQHQLRAEIYSQKSPLGCKFIRVNNCLVCGPKYTNFFRPTWEGLWMIKSFWFLTCWSFPEIFAIKVDSGQKLQKILDDFFAVTNFRGRTL